MKAANGSLGSKTIHTINRVNGLYTCCRVREVAQDGSNSARITIDDMVFEKFIDILKEDIGYKPLQHMISYFDIEEAKMGVLNGRTWRAALEEIDGRGIVRFIFTVEKISNI